MSEEDSAHGDTAMSSQREVEFAPEPQPNATDQPPAPPEPTKFELFIIRLLVLPVEVFCRVADLTLLALRPRLLWAYFGIWARELLRSPYRWPRSFETILLLRQSGQSLEELMYGELPVFSAIWLFWRAGLRRSGSLLDLGAGRGRPMLGARFLGAAARGIELQPAHVSAVTKVLARVQAQLEQGDALRAELTSPAPPTHVLLNWCAMAKRTRDALEQRLVQLPEGTRILAVGCEPVRPEFVPISSHRALFTWGLARVRIYELRVPRV